MPKKVSDFTSIESPSDDAIVYVVDSTEDTVDRKWSLTNILAWVRAKFASTPVAVDEGGTGSTSAGDARTALGLDGDSNTTHYHDGRYYTETELDAGQLDDRYYTETESDARYLLETNNLSDLDSAATARTNLDVYSQTEVDTEVTTLEQRIVEHSKRLGELYWLIDYLAPSEWNSASPDDYHPGLCLSAIDGHSDISMSNWPDLVPELRTHTLTYLKGKTGETEEWSASVSGSDITMPSSTSSDAVLAALAEDQLVHGSYTDWRTVNVAGTDYTITGINTTTRVITVSGTPSSGTQTVKFYPHRIAGSTTTARVFEVNGRTLVSAGDADGEAFAGLLRRDRMESHIHNLTYATSTGSTRDKIPNTNDTTSGSADTGTGGVLSARTGATTDPRAMIGHLYIHGRRYLSR